MKNAKLNKIIGNVIFVIIVAGTAIFAIYTTWRVHESQQQKVVVKQVEKLYQYPDFDAIKGENPDRNIKCLKIVENFTNKNPVTKNYKDGVKKYFKVKGKFSRAYLYIEAMVDNNRPLTVWDDVYFKINEDDGGHLIDVNNLAKPSSEISKYLYDLRSLYYYPTVEEKKKEATANLFELLKDEEELKINAFISSARPGGVMKEVSIYYECLKGSKCSIEEIKEKGK